MTGQGTDNPMPGGLLGALAVVRFLAELGLLVTLGWVGFHLTDWPVVPCLLLAVLLPALAAGAWGLWVAPRARRRLSDPARLAVEVTLFGLAVLGLRLVGPEPGAAISGTALAVAYLASAIVGRRGF